MALGDFKQIFVEMEDENDDTDAFHDTPHFFSFETFQFFADNADRFKAVQTYFKTVVRSIYLGNLRIGFNGADGTSTYLTETDFEKEEEYSKDDAK